MRFVAGLLVHSRLFVALSLTLPIAIGCPGPKPLGKPVPVKGKITYQGKPAPAGCVITFIHSERNFPASAEIAADGSYTLLFNGKPEVPVGTYKVSVTPPAAAAAQAASADPSNPEAYKAMMMKQGISKGDEQAEVVTIPTKYATPETSGVTFTVVEEPTSYDLDMKD